MRQIFRTFGAIAAAAMLAAGFAGTALAQGAEQQPGAEQGQGAAGPAGATRPLEMPVLFVTGIEVLRGAIDPKSDIIRVSGLVSSHGWSNPELVPFFSVVGGLAGRESGMDFDSIPESERQELHIHYGFPHRKILGFMPSYPQSSLFLRSLTG